MWSAGEHPGSLQASENHTQQVLNGFFHLGIALGDGYANSFDKLDGELRKPKHTNGASAKMGRGLIAGFRSAGELF